VIAKSLSENAGEVHKGGPSISFRDTLRASLPKRFSGFSFPFQSFMRVTGNKRLTDAAAVEGGDDDDNGDAVAGKRLVNGAAWRSAGRRLQADRRARRQQDGSLLSQSVSVDDDHQVPFAARQLL